MINAQKLQDALHLYYSDSRKIYPTHTNRASEMGHDCVRFLVFNRVRWQDKMLHDVLLEVIFQEGNYQEEAVKKTLAKAGFELTQQQRGYFETQQNITGHLDSFLSHPEILPKPIPIEIKGLSQNNWSSINKFSDILEHKQYYIRKYAAQINLYMYMSEEDEGLFVLKNKQNGQIKFIPAELDYEYTEGLLKKAEKINDYVEKYKKNGHIPDETTQDAKICAGCAFRHICFKDSDPYQGITLIQEKIAEDGLVRMKELEDAAKEYEELKEVVYDIIKKRAEAINPPEGKAQFLVGEFHCKASVVKTKKYEIPAEVKEQFARPNKYWKVSDVERI